MTYDRIWTTATQARRWAKLVRMVFMVTVTKITYAAYLLPSHWLEEIQRHGYIDAHEANAVRESSICQLY